MQTSAQPTPSITDTLIPAGVRPDAAIAKALQEARLLSSTLGEPTATRHRNDLRTLAEKAEDAQYHCVNADLAGWFCRREARDRYLFHAEFVGKLAGFYAIFFYPKEPATKAALLGLSEKIAEAIHIWRREIALTKRAPFSLRRAIRNFFRASDKPLQPGAPNCAVAQVHAHRVTGLQVHSVERVETAGA